ncbi:MAG TPA: DUF692 family protein, partial [Nitrolancea sp.]|nr:DUF692 family protein [Nitrolancea sp.]
MTLLGVKWSPIAGGALPLVDIVEVAGWDLREVLPGEHQLLHNLDLDFSLGVPHVLDDVWLARCRAAIERTRSPWFSLHLGFSSERVRFDGHMLPESPVLDRATCLERMIDAVGFARRYLDVPLLIENLDYCPEGAYEHVCEPAFITEVVSATDCDLLLDLAHLQVSADWLGYSPEVYAELLPLDRVVEVHVSSPRRSGERLDDVHEALLERDE